MSDATVIDVARCLHTARHSAQMRRTLSPRIYVSGGLGDARAARVVRMRYRRTSAFGLQLECSVSERGGMSG